MRRQPIIDVKNLGLTYVTRTSRIHALDDITCTIYEEEFVSVVGQSGCGKSTFLKTVGGLLEPTKGEVLIDGRRVTKPTREVGIVFQDPVLLPWRITLKNVLFPIEIIGLDQEEYRKIALDLIDLTGLKGFEDKYPFQLSGGMKQRVAIARALITDPKILLMDEPFGSLDAITRETMNVELLRIWREKRKSVVFVTHNIDEACFLSDRVIIMTPRPGKIAKILDIDIPRPRKIEHRALPNFGDYVLDIHESIGLT